MLTRRTFLGGAAVAVAVPLVTALPGTADAARTLPLDLVNRRPGHRLYAVVSGLDRASGRWFFLAADGRSRYVPATPAKPMTPRARDVAIPVARSRRIALPRLDSGRVYLSFDRRLRFFVNPGIVTPSVANPAGRYRARDEVFLTLADELGAHRT